MNLIGKISLFLLTNSALMYGCYNKKIAVNTPDCLNFSPLFYAVQNGDLETVTRLLEVNADPNTHTQEETPLNAAIRSQQPALVNLLLARKANVNVANKKDGKTALHQVIETNICNNPTETSSEMLLLILNEGPDLSVRDNNRDTALMIAIKNKRSDLVELLLADKENNRTSDNDSE